MLKKIVQWFAAPAKSAGTYHKDAQGFEEQSFVASLHKAVEDSDPEVFAMHVDDTITEIPEAVLREYGFSPRLVFLFINYNYVESHIDRAFATYEGIPCCSDKSSVIIKSLVRHWINDEPIVFNYDQEYTFHLPKAILRTQEDILTYFKAIEDAFYGHVVGLIDAHRSFKDASEAFYRND